MKFSSLLLNWYQEHKRDLPWRLTTDPYHIWLSEIILQQTRIEQGLAYYFKFIKTYPQIALLAAATEEDVLKLWQGLGYYSRARYLHETAKIIVEQHDGVFPKTYSELLRLKGIGEYTAAAIASICFNEAVIALDANALRVLARFFAIEHAIDRSGGKAKIKRKALKVMDYHQAGNFNQALMDFGSIQCSAKNPKCFSCPFQNNCKAFQKNLVNQLPVKANRIKVSTSYFNYLVYVNNKGLTLFQKRLKDDIWKHLYQFPLIETKNEIGETEIYDHLKSRKIKARKLELFKEKALIHKLSHKKLHIRFWIIHTNEDLKEAIPIKKLNQYPSAKPIASFVEEFISRYNILK